jgi:hypothetical protein
MDEAGTILPFESLCLVLIVTYIPLSIRITKTSVIVARKASSAD